MSLVDLGADLPPGCSTCVSSARHVAPIGLERKGL